LAGASSIGKILPKGASPKSLAGAGILFGEWESKLFVQVVPVVLCDPMKNPYV
jgi:hypothetical protein